MTIWAGCERHRQGRLGVGRAAGVLVLGAGDGHRPGRGPVQRAGDRVDRVGAGEVGVDPRQGLRHRVLVGAVGGVGPSADGDERLERFRRPERGAVDDQVFPRRRGVRGDDEFPRPACAARLRGPGGAAPAAAAARLAACAARRVRGRAARPPSAAAGHSRRAVAGGRAEPGRVVDPHLPGRPGPAGGRPPGAAAAAAGRGSGGAVRAAVRPGPGAARAAPSGGGGRVAVPGAVVARRSHARARPAGPGVRERRTARPAVEVDGVRRAGPFPAFPAATGLERAMQTAVRGDDKPRVPANVDDAPS